MSFVRINISFARINIPFERIDIPFAQHIFFLKKILRVLKIPPSGKSYYYKRPRLKPYSICLDFGSLY